MDVTPTPGPPYEWDENKRQETIRLRGLDFAMVNGIDWDTATSRRRVRGDEIRYASLAMLGDRLYHVVWTLRDPNTRIISFRKANDREIARYEQEQT